MNFFYVLAVTELVFDSDYALKLFLFPCSF